MKVPLEAVGKNLGDHPSFIMSGFSVSNATLFPKIDSSETEKIMGEFHNGEGILTLITEAQQAFIVSSKADPGWPDIWISMDPNIRIDDAEQQVHFFDILGRPQSKGTLTLDTDKYKAGIKDDVQLALIDYQFLSHPDDMEVLLDGKI